MSDNKQTPRNAGVRQNRNNVAVNERAAFDNLGLTKRNAEYMYRFNKALEKTKLTPERKSEAVQSMVNELIEGQKSGKTGKNTYGDIDERVKLVVEGPQKPDSLFGGRDYWPNMIYNALTFFMIFNLMFGLIYFFSPKMMTSSQPVGITAITVSALVAGFALPVMPRVFDPKIKHRYNGWMRTLLVVLVFIVWMVLFFSAQLLPPVINPILQPKPSIALGLISIAIMLWMRRHYNIRGGLLG